MTCNILEWIYRRLIVGDYWCRGKIPSQKRLKERKTALIELNRHYSRAVVGTGFELSWSHFENGDLIIFIYLLRRRVVFFIKKQTLEVTEKLEWVVVLIKGPMKSCLKGVAKASGVRQAKISGFSVGKKSEELRRVYRCSENEKEEVE